METKGKIGISVAEAAVELGVSRPVMYDIVSREDFPKVRVGRRIIIPRQGLVEWLARESGGNGGNNYANL